MSHSSPFMNFPLSAIDWAMECRDTVVSQRPARQPLRFSLDVGESLRFSSGKRPHCDCDPGTEELGHLEMVAAIVHQLTRNLSAKEIEKSPLAPYFVDHTAGIYPTAASGFPWSAAGIQSTGDPIADLTEDLAAEQKARLTYDNILRLSDDPDVNDAIRFLREREIVHFQRFGEALELARRRMNEKNIYLFNPGFDQK